MSVFLFIKKHLLRVNEKGISSNKVFMDGISRHEVGRFLDLREKKFVIQFTKDELHEFIRKNLLKLAGVCIFLIAVLGYFWTSYNARASITVLFPDTCLGGWQNVSAAQGEIDVEDNDPSKFNKSNSAYITDTVSQIFCGNFNGNLPNESKTKKVTLNISWAIQYPTSAVTDDTSGVKDVGSSIVDGVTIDASSSTSTEDISGAKPKDDAFDSNEDFSSSARNKVNDDKTNTEESTPSPLVPSDTPVVEVSPAEPVNVEIQPAPSAPEESASLSSSMYMAFVESAKLYLINFVAPLVFANDEVVTESTSSTSSDSLVDSTLVPIVDDVSTSTLDSISTDDTPVASTSEYNVRPPLPHEDVLFTVYYTVDGDNWNELGTVTGNEIGKKNFEIPGIASKSDLSKLQINIRSAVTSDEEATVYLDGMSLQVEYDEMSEEEIQKLPRVEVDATEIFNETIDDFSTSQQAEFEIDLFNNTADAANSPAGSTTVDLAPVEVIPVESTSTKLESSEVPSEDLSFDSSIFKALSFIKKNITPTVAEAAGDITLKKVLKAKVIGPDGKLYTDTPVITEKNGKVKISVPRRSNNFRPGQYKIVVEVLSEEKVLVTTQDFTWGVLAINADKSTYTPGETAYLQLSTLSPQGHAICDANLRLKISDPDGVVTTLQTVDGTIEKSGICTKNNVTDIPDHFAYFKTSKIGLYSIVLENLDKGYNISDSLKVTSNQDYVIERVGATRINPFASTYVMRFKVISQNGFQGQITEKVPSGFEVSSSTQGALFVEGSDDLKITWNVSMEAGEKRDFFYEYQAPMISPELYILGPITANKDNVGMSQGSTSASQTYTEERVWQLASDAVCNAITTGNWNDGTKWSGCSGVGGVPDATDDVTINSGVTMTVTASASVNSVTIAANSSATFANGININPGVTLAVTEMLQ